MVLPKKLERCVKSVMEKQGMTEERAYAICNASIDHAIVYDQQNSIKSKIDPITGFLTANVVLARTGIQKYYGFELGLTDRAAELISVFRSPDEVFNEDSINSFTNLVVTDDHPSGFVTTDNVKKLQKGQISNVKRTATDYLHGTLTITDKNQIEKIKKGKNKASVGYFHKLIKKDGVYNGEPYEYMQTDIKANHLAIVEEARCGADCSIIFDSKKGSKPMFAISIDGINYQTDNEALVKAVNELKKSYDKKIKDKMDKEEEEKEEKESMKKEMDSLKAQKDALEKTKLTDADISKIVNERVQILDTARRILGDSMPDCVDCPEELKVAVIDHVIPGMKLDTASSEYVHAAYEIAVAQYDKTQKNIDGLQNDFANKKSEDSLDTIRVKARNEYIANLTK